PQPQRALGATRQHSVLGRLPDEPLGYGRDRGRGFPDRGGQGCAARALSNRGRAVSIGERREAGVAEWRRSSAARPGRDLSEIDGTAMRISRRLEVTVLGLICLAALVLRTVDLRGT